MLSVIILNAIMVNVIMLKVVMLNVVAPHVEPLVGLNCKARLVTNH